MIDIHKIITEYSINNKSSTEIGKMLGISRVTVLRILKKHSIPIRRRTNKCVFNDDFFSTIDTEQKAYWLGFITADGNVHRDESTLQINLSAVDEGHLAKLAMIFRREVKSIKHSKTPMRYFSIYSKRLCGDLIQLGVLPNKTDEDQSAIFNNVPNHLKRHFIRGLFDGDGSIAQSNKYKKHFTFAVIGEHRLMSEVANFICEKTGIRTPKIATEHRCSRIRWSGLYQCLAILEWLYDGSEIFLARKRVKMDALKARPSKKKTYYGVSKTISKKWNAAIWQNNTRIHIGNFETAEDAAHAYNVYADSIGLDSYKRNHLPGKQ
jgi:intein-encoded DNA endonuclease-like protein